MTTDVTRRVLGDDRRDTTRRWRSVRMSGRPTRQTRTAAAAAAYSPHQKTVAAALAVKSCAGPQLVRQREADAEVGVEVQQVPRLVAQPRAAPSCTDGDDDHDERDGAGEGQQHARGVQHLVDEGAR